MYMYIYICICICIYYFEIRGIKNYIFFTTFSFTYLFYDLQVNIDATLIFTDDMLTILP